MAAEKPVSNGDGDHDYATQRGDTNIPVPDPTRLTTQLVDRALSAFREVVFERMRGMDRASTLLAEDLVKLTANQASSHEHMREEFGQALDALRESYELKIKNVADVSLEKFAAIDTRFQERDTRTEQSAQESRISLDAALAAAKEAVSEQNKANTLAIGKSEYATQKQIDAMGELMTTSNRALEDKIVDLKGRLDRGEGQEKGTTETRQRNQIQSNWSIGALMTVGLALMGSVIAIAIAILNHK